MSGNNLEEKLAAARYSLSTKKGELSRLRKKIITIAFTKQMKDKAIAEKEQEKDELDKKVRSLEQNAANRAAANRAAAEAQAAANRAAVEAQAAANRAVQAEANRVAQAEANRVAAKAAANALGNKKFAEITRKRAEENQKARQVAKEREEILKRKIQNRRNNVAAEAQAAANRAAQAEANRVAAAEAARTEQILKRTYNSTNSYLAPQPPPSPSQVAAKIKNAAKLHPNLMDTQEKLMRPQMEQPLVPKRNTLRSKAAAASLSSATKAAARERANAAARAIAATRERATVSSTKKGLRLPTPTFTSSLNSIPENLAENINNSVVAANVNSSAVAANVNSSAVAANIKRVVSQGNEASSGTLPATEILAAAAINSAAANGVSITLPAATEAARLVVNNPSAASIAAGSPVVNSSVVSKSLRDLGAQVSVAGINAVNAITSIAASSPASTASAAVQKSSASILPGMTVGHPSASSLESSVPGRVVTTKTISITKISENGRDPYYTAEILTQPSLTRAQTRGGRRRTYRRSHKRHRRHKTHRR
jgi:hypothetical protein